MRLLSRFFPLLLIISVVSFSCGRLNTFEQNATIPGHRWSHAFVPELTFDIKDTSSLYRSYLILRHTHAYAYRNIWLELSTRQPGDSVFRTEKIELILQQDDGQWIGTGLSDIWEIRYPLITALKFQRSGKYTVRIAEVMRDEPLEHIMSAGLRIEKIQR